MKPCKNKECDDYTLLRKSKCGKFPNFTDCLSYQIATIFLDTSQEGEIKKRWAKDELIIQPEETSLEKARELRDEFLEDKDESNNMAVDMSEYYEQVIKELKGNQ